MSPATASLTIYQNASFERQCVLRASGQPVDLTGWTILAEVRPGPDEDVIVAFNVILDPEPGVFTLTLTPEQTSRLNFQTAFYDVLVVSPTGRADRLLEGEVTLSPGITELRL